MKKQLISVFLIIILLFVYGTPSPVFAGEFDTRQSLYEKVGTLSGIPWYYLAAMDQYERNLQQVRQDLEKRRGPVAITVPPKLWSGVTNPDPFDTIPESIRFFGGIGKDGNGDGKADPAEPLDVLYTITSYLKGYGDSRDDIRIGLWNYYQHPTAVDLVTHYAEIYRHFETTRLDRFSFVMPLHSHYTYHDTWGARRGWGGIRIHEGTDIFASYGTPVLSTVYGYVELKGWNRYGGWRIGIRDLRNNYHYYAHLSSFDKNIEKGSIVQPGQVIGYVGSSGYGPPGTSGKFPPHLHYGIYKFNGHTTYAFDPYPFLKSRERAEYKKLKEARKAKRNLKK